MARGGLREEFLKAIRRALGIESLEGYGHVASGGGRQLLMLFDHLAYRSC